MHFLLIDILFKNVLSESVCVLSINRSVKQL